MVDMKFVVCITVWIEIFTYDRSKEENLFSIIYNKKYIMGYALNASDGLVSLLSVWSCEERNFKTSSFDSTKIKIDLN